MTRSCDNWSWYCFKEAKMKFQIGLVTLRWWFDVRNLLRRGLCADKSSLWASNILPSSDTRLRSNSSPLFQMLCRAWMVLEDVKVRLVMIYTLVIFLVRDCGILSVATNEILKCYKTRLIVTLWYSWVHISGDTKTLDTGDLSSVSGD